jgi:predicted ArsR family transcriptional regulator
MANRRIDPRRIKTHFPYTVEEAADALGVHKNTVRMWIKAGLEVADDRRPTGKGRYFVELYCPVPSG